MTDNRIKIFITSKQKKIKQTEIFKFCESWENNKISIIQC
jgi:hypothetical protein